MAEAAFAGTVVSDRNDRFFVWMAAICAACAFGFFSLTYWGPLATGRFHGPPVFHVHGIVFSSWTLLLVWQADLAAKRSVVRHRAFGMLGAAIATAMVFTGLWASVASIKLQEAAGHGEAARTFAIVPVTAILLFAGLVIAAIVNVKRPEWHKRLMLIATASILQAAVARVFFVLTRASPNLISPADAPPATVALSIVPGVIVDLLIVAGMVYDWRTRGRVHPAYLVGGTLVVALQFLRVPLSETAAWQGFIDWLIHIAGG